MKQFTPEQVTIESASSLNLLNQDRHREGDHYAAYVGLDVHKKTIAVAIAYRGRGKPVSRAEIVNTPKAVRKLVALLNQEFGGEILLYSDEAGPCGYDLYHQLTALGQECEIVAPSLIPRKPGDRVKTDKRDARGLARYSRSGELTPVWVPAKEQEAMRDLTRAREDIKNVEKMTKQQLGGFLASAWQSLRQHESSLDKDSFQLVRNSEV
jgi:transposase